jgi:hypothetical protein
VMCPVFMVNPPGVLFSLDPLLRPVYGYANMAATDLGFSVPSVRFELTLYGF